MLQPALITKQSPFLGEECALCKDPFAPGAEIVVCPEDGSRHHVHCWQRNHNKCAAYGCRGQGSIQLTEAESDAATESNTQRLPPPFRSRSRRTVITRPISQFGCSQTCLVFSIALAIIFFSIGCFGLWAIADYIMLEVLGWQYRSGAALWPIFAAQFPHIQILFL